MAPKRPLPPQLSARVFFTVRRARELGVTRATMADLARPHRSVLGTRMPLTVLEDAQAASLVLPAGCVFTHWTGIWLRGLVVGRGWMPEHRPPLDVGVHGRTPPRLATVTGHRLLAPDLPTIVLPGLAIPVLDDAHLFRQVAGDLSVADRVVLGDLMVAWRSGRGDDYFDEALAIRSCGVVAARAASRQVRPGTNSVMESRVRQDFVREGLPAPELNAQILDDRGALVGYADFLWRRARVVVEYNGAHHYRTDEQRLQDEARRNRMERLGYLVILINKVDYYDHHAETMAAVRAALVVRGALAA